MLETQLVNLRTVIQPEKGRARVGVAGYVCGMKRFRVCFLGYGVQGSAFRVLGLGFRVSDEGLERRTVMRVSGFRVSTLTFLGGFGFRVPGFGFRISG